MFLKSVSVAALLAIACRALSEPEPYMWQSSRGGLGLGRRQKGSGYEPTQTFCGTGSTCAEACGAGMATCQSTDNAIHCYNTTALQTCCSDGSGNSCDEGYYCALSTEKGTLCCPDGQSLAACAQSYGASGSLSSELPQATSSSVSSSASSSSSSSVSSVSSASSSFTWGANSTTAVPPTGYLATSTTPGAAPGTGYGAVPTGPGTSASPSNVVVSGARVAQPARAVLVLVTAAFAALL